MVVFNPPWDGYGVVARYRHLGASAAARAGAVAMLLRSVGSHSIGSPHTGSGPGYMDEIDGEATKAPHTPEGLPRNLWGGMPGSNDTHTIPIPKVRSRH